MSSLGRPPQQTKFSFLKICRTWGWVANQGPPRSKRTNNSINSWRSQSICFPTTVRWGLPAAVSVVTKKRAAARGKGQGAKGRSFWPANRSTAVCRCLRIHQAFVKAVVSKVVLTRSFKTQKKYQKTAETFGNMLKNNLGALDIFPLLIQGHNCSRQTCF